MQATHWILVCVSALIGAAVGAIGGWASVGFVLMQSGRGGHADLPIMLMAAAAGLLVGLTVPPLQLYRRIRRQLHEASNET